MSRRPLETGRLRLLPFEEGDEDVLFGQWNDPDVRRFLFDDEPVSRELVREQIRRSDARFEAGQPGFYRIVLGGPEPVTIGFVGLRSYGPEQRVEVLYALLPSYWGQGLATEAARAVLERGFEDPTLTAIDAGADPPNAASFGVMRRLGMTRLEDVTLPGAPGVATYFTVSREAFTRRRRSS